jgi:hypothetical protein
VAAIWHDVGMRWADLILSYIRVLIWPTVVFGLLVIFRVQVRTIISHFAEKIKDLKSLRVPGAEFDFEQALIDNRQDLVAHFSGHDLVIEPEFPPEQPEEAPKLNRERFAFWLKRAQPFLAGGRLAEGRLVAPIMTDLAQDSPQTTIVAAWQQVDSTIRLLYRKLNPGESVSACGTIDQARNVCRALANHGVLDNPDSLLTVIMRLSNMRNSAEGRTITKLEAYEYASSAFEVSQHETAGSGFCP